MVWVENSTQASPVTVTVFGRQKSQPSNRDSISHFKPTMPQPLFQGDNTHLNANVINLVAGSQFNYENQGLHSLSFGHTQLGN